ncbi:MAG TPA: DUF177 domain-containing protein [Chthonomonadales bacterium]|nr:DUF177 domain-containing protein [Chthonomonadales bacterium]
MRLDLSEVLSRIGARYPYKVDEPPIVDEDLECVAPIRGDLVFSNTGSVLLASGSVEATVTLACGRCLEYFDLPLAIAIDEQFTLQRRPGIARGRVQHAVVEDDENPDAARLFEGPLFDLTELLRQGIWLGLPLRPLHDEGCAGLCPRCGANLNRGPCGCPPEPPAGQLGTLAELLARRSSEGA